MSMAHSSPHISSDIVFDILEGNVQNSFDIVKREEHGIIVGEWKERRSEGMQLAKPYAI